MNGFRVFRPFVALLAGVAFGAAAEAPADPKAPAVTTHAQATKSPPKAPPKATAKKAPAKKAASKAPPKKVDSKVHGTPQGGTVQKFEAGKAPVLRDSKGNVVPTSPEAYDVSSATSPPPKKK